MLTTDLDFQFPEELIATEPSRPSRVAWIESGQAPRELGMSGLLEVFRAGDVLVLNESKVVPARIFTHDEIEVLFLKQHSLLEWEVLFTARGFKTGETLSLPGGASFTLEQKGLPQRVRTSVELTPEYFARHGEVALPPYIQEKRGQRRNRAEDQRWYQTAWAKNPGSVAAPTASLHFTDADLENLKGRGVKIHKVTLHVGAGTFMPVRAEVLSDHTMHAEVAEVPAETAEAVRTATGRVWALGTTVARTLESMAGGLLEKQPGGGYAGSTKLFIYPPYEFKIVDGLLTNFHQPKSTLLGLVSAFAGHEETMTAYRWAIGRGFRLFSYGDLSAWTKD